MASRLVLRRCLLLLVLCRGAAFSSHLFQRQLPRPSLRNTARAALDTSELSALPRPSARLRRAQLRLSEARGLLPAGVADSIFESLPTSADGNYEAVSLPTSPANSYISSSFQKFTRVAEVFKSLGSTYAARNSLVSLWCHLVLWLGHQTIRPGGRRSIPLSATGRMARAQC